MEWAEFGFGVNLKSKLHVVVQYKLILPEADGGISKKADS
jgi:hypothetical protein